MGFFSRRGSTEAAVEHMGESVVGYKAASLLISLDGETAAFQGLTWGAGHIYGVNSEGKCQQRGTHKVPNHGCGCGFHMYKSKARAWGLQGDSGANNSDAVLEVVGSGRWTEYELLYRTQRQRVRAVTVGSCFCDRPGVVLGGIDKEGGWQLLSPCCEFHLPMLAGEVVVPFEKLSALLGVPVHGTAGLRGLSDLEVQARLALCGEPSIRFAQRASRPLYMDQRRSASNSSAVAISNKAMWGFTVGAGAVIGVVMNLALALSGVTGWGAYIAAGGVATLLIGMVVFGDWDGALSWQKRVSGVLLVAVVFLATAVIAEPWVSSINSITHQQATLDSSLSSGLGRLAKEDVAADSSPNLVKLTNDIVFAYAGNSTDSIELALYNGDASKGRAVMQFGVDYMNRCYQGSAILTANGAQVSSEYVSGAGSLGECADTIKKEPAQPTPTF